MNLCVECQTHYTRRDNNVCYRCNEKRNSDALLAAVAPKSPIRFPLPAGTSLACQNKPELFFAQGQVQLEAKALCNACPAYAWCLEWATENDEEGVWAGLTRGQRRARRLTRGQVELIA